MVGRPGENSGNGRRRQATTEPGSNSFALERIHNATRHSLSNGVVLASDVLAFCEPGATDYAVGPLCAVRPRVASVLRDRRLGQTFWRPIRARPSNFECGSSAVAALILSPCGGVAAAEGRAPAFARGVVLSGLGRGMFRAELLEGEGVRVDAGAQ